MTTFTNDDGRADFAHAVKRAASVLHLATEITPPRLTPPIRAFCQSVSSERPLVVRRNATNEARPCSSIAVARRVLSDGGSSLSGWMIKCMPGLWATAEFRVVWVSENNRLLDVTPNNDGEDAIVFLPGSASFDVSVEPPTLHERLLTDESEIEIVEAFVASLEPNMRTDAEKMAKSKG
jgi:hypothetical protein